MIDNEVVKAMDAAHGLWTADGRYVVIYDGSDNVMPIWWILQDWIPAVTARGIDSEEARMWAPATVELVTGTAIPVLLSEDDALEEDDESREEDDEEQDGLYCRPEFWITQDHLGGYDVHDVTPELLADILLDAYSRLAALSTTDDGA